VVAGPGLKTPKLLSWDDASGTLGGDTVSGERGGLLRAGEELHSSALLCSPPCPPKSIVDVTATASKFCDRGLERPDSMQYGETDDGNAVFIIRTARVGCGLQSAPGGNLTYNTVTTTIIANWGCDAPSKSEFGSARLMMKLGSIGQGRFR